MTYLHIIFLSVVVALTMVVAIPLELRIHRNMQKYWKRSCTSFKWRRAFPDSQIAEIREFLTIFRDSFAFRESHLCCFTPEDKVMEIYHTLYPERLMADSMELETLASVLQERYRVDAETFWHEDITLGEIYKKTRKEI